MDIEKFFSIDKIRKCWDNLDTNKDNFVDNRALSLFKQLYDIVIDNYNSNAIHILLDELNSLINIRFSTDWQKLDENKQLEVIKKLIDLLNNIEDLIDISELDI